MAHPVVIYFWASWCDPECTAVQPDLTGLAARYPTVHFVGDDVRDNVANARAYVLDLQVPYPGVFDQLGVNIQSFHVVAIPATIVLNSTGEIVGRYLGTVSGISQRLAALLSNGA